MSQDNNVWIYHAELPDRAALPREWSELSPAEVARAQAIRNANRQSEFVLSRCLTKRALADFLRVPLAEIEISIDPGKKPHLLNSERQVEFNQSHCHFKWVLAVAEERLVGVDVEPAQRAINPKIFQRILSAFELNELQFVHPDWVSHALLRAWCQKESMLKGMGLGLGLDPRRIEVEIDPEKPVGLRNLDVPQDCEWKLAHLRIDPDYICVLAAEGVDWVIQAQKGL